MSIERKQLRPYLASKSSDQTSVPALLGTWQNEIGSTMTVTSFDGTNFSGSYTSAVSEGSGPATGTLSGTLAGNAIAFTVNWLPIFPSVTGWNGLLLTASDELVIYSLWNGEYGRGYDGFLEVDRGRRGHVLPGSAVEE